MLNKTLFSLRIEQFPFRYHWWLPSVQGEMAVLLYPIHTQAYTWGYAYSVKAYKYFLWYLFLVICGKPLGGWGCMSTCLYLHVCLHSISWGWIYMRWPIFSTHTKRERESWAHELGPSSETQFHSEERELKEKQQERDLSDNISHLRDLFIFFWKNHC